MTLRGMTECCCPIAFSMMRRIPCYLDRMQEAFMPPAFRSDRLSGWHYRQIASIRWEVAP